MKKNFVFKTAAAATLCLTVTAGALLPARALAWDWLSAGAAVFQVGAQYAYLNRQIHYLDNKGRNQHMAQIKDKYGVNQDPAANAMLDRIMGRLSDAIALSDPSITKKPYKYFVNNEKSFNAFCTVGHNLSVNIGTFDKLNYNENEIAFVVAHEIGHGQKQHPAAGVKRGLPLSLLAALYSSQNPNAASIIGATLVNALGTARLVTLPMEKEADRLAFDYAVAAGYNVGGGAALWQHILERNGKESSGFASVFNDHPTSVSRRDEYSRRITKWSGNAVKVEKDTGAITVQGKHFYTPAKTTSLSSAEQAYLIAGNLAAVYHNKANSRTVRTNGAHMLMVGDQPIMTLNGVANAATVQRRLQDILQDKKVQTAKVQDKKVQTAKVQTKAAAEKKSDSKKGRLD